MKAPDVGRAHCIVPGIQNSMEAIFYSQPCPLTKEVKEDLNWWVTHPASWNGEGITRGNPDLTIETDTEFQHRLGCPVWQPTDRRAMVSHRGGNAHQLPRASGSNLGDTDFCQETGDTLVHLNGQHVRLDVHQQDGRYDLPKPQSAHQGSLDLVPSQEYHLQSLPPSGCSRGIPEDHERSLRLDALLGNIQKNPNTVWSIGDRLVCVETDETTSDSCQLVAIPTSSRDTSTRSL